MKTTLSEVRRLIREALLAELKLVGGKDAVQGDKYRVYMLMAHSNENKGNFVVVPYDLPVYGRGDKGYITTKGGVSGYVEDLGFKAGAYYVSEGSALVVDHGKKTIDLDVAERSAYHSRRRGKTGHKTYTIPHADTSFDSLHELQKVIKAIMGIDPQVTDDYDIVGSLNYEDMSVGEVLKQERHGDTIVKGGQSKPMTFYHGTSNKRLAGIKTKGLVPGSTPEAYSDLVSGYSEHNIYLSTTVTQAENYATRAAVDDRAKAVVLKVVVHDLTKIIVDEDNTNWLNVTNPEGEEVQVHFKHIEGWRNWPNAPQIMQKYMSLIAKSVNQTGAVAYKGRIPARDVSVYSTYKPASMQKDPEWSEYKAARDKTLDTYKKEESK